MWVGQVTWSHFTDEVSEAEGEGRGLLCPGGTAGCLASRLEAPCGHRLHLPCHLFVPPCPARGLGIQQVLDTYFLNG